MATFWTKKTGSAGNPGTEALPKLTIAQGIGLLSAGDTLMIGNGTYVEALDNVIPSGTSGNPTIIQAENRNGVIIRPTSGLYPFHINGRTYITIDGIDCDAITGEIPVYVQNSTFIVVQNGKARNGQGQYGSGIEFRGPSSDCSAINNDVENNGDSAYAHGIYVGGARALIDGNRVSGSSGYGIHLYNGIGGVNDCIVRNNIVQTSANPAGLIISSGFGNIAYNNIFKLNNKGIRVLYGATNTKLFNNTIYGNAQEALEIDSSCSGTTYRNNIFFGNGVNTPANSGTGTIQSNNLIGGVNPFVDASNGDFHITSASAARDAGFNLAAEFTTDIEGTARPQGATFDIGAYEFFIATPGPTLTSIAPTNGIQGEVVALTLNGSTFVAPMTVNVSGTQVTVTNVVVVTTILATCTVTIGANALTGVRTLSVTTTGGTSGNQNFTVNTSVIVTGGGHKLKL